MLRNSSAHSAATPANCAFHEGDSVYLAKGSYQGTLGTFLHLRSDPNWAEVREADGAIRMHPVEWIALSGPSN